MADLSTPKAKDFQPQDEDHFWLQFKVLILRFKI